MAQQIRRKNKKPAWIDEKKLEDPMFWFMKAHEYCSASLYILDQFKKIKNGDKVSHLFNAINATPYLTGLAAELFMKGYLVSKKVDPKKLAEKKIGHDLKVLRDMCLKYGDARFKNDPLIFLTDNLGVHIMKEGGIRYPDKGRMAVYNTQFEESLRVLREITGDVARELATWDSRKDEKS